MTHADLIELAEYHASESQNLEGAAKLFNAGRVRDSLTERATWHANKSAQLRELADSFTQIVTVQS